MLVTDEVVLAVPVTDADDDAVPVTVRVGDTVNDEVNEAVDE